MTPRLLPRRGVGALGVGGDAHLASGFTLLEVLAAIALLALAFAIGLAALGRSAHNASRAVALDTAVARAQTLLAAQGLAVPLKTEALSGRFADGMRWSLRVRALPRPPARPDRAFTAPAASPGRTTMMAQAQAIDVYRLDVAVQYGAGRTLRLATERAQAAPADLR